MKVGSRALAWASSFLVIFVVVNAQTSCSRPTRGKSWAISKITLDRVRRCQNYWFFCISRLSRSDYKPFDKSHLRSQQKKLFLSQVNVPKKADTKNVVLGFAGQQMHSRLLSERGQVSGITGQKDGYSELFKRHDASVPYTVASGSLINEIIRTGLFSKEDTFVGLVFDAQFDFEFHKLRKASVETGYFNYIVSKLSPNVETIYLAAHSRGGCLCMRLSARLAQKFPKARIIVHNFDGVCAPEGTILQNSEFGVGMEMIENPVRKGYRVLTTNIAEQFSTVDCVAVRSFLSGEQVIAEPVHAFGHSEFADAQDSLATSKGFSWYTQSFHTEGHIAIAGRHHATAVDHLRKAFNELPCTCRA